MNAIVIHLGFWSPSAALQSGTKRPGMTLIDLGESVTLAHAPGQSFAASNGYPDKGVSVTRRRGMAYSMSVGDVVKIGHAYFLCLPMGWEEISERKFREVYHKATGNFERLRRAEFARIKQRDRDEDNHSAAFWDDWHGR